MSQNEIINYLCSSIKLLQKQQKDIEEQKRIADFEAKNPTLEQRISTCAQKCAKDLDEFNQLMTQYINEYHADQTK